MAPQRRIREATLTKLRTLSEHSLTRAAQSLTALLEHPVHLQVAGIISVDSGELPAVLAGHDVDVVAGLRVQIVGEAAGQIIILFPLRTVKRMVRALLGTGGEPQRLSERERSAVQEVGNILASSFVSGLGDHLGKRLMSSPPEVHLDDLVALMGQVAANLGEPVSKILVVQARFEDPEQRIEGQFFVLPELASLEAMLYPAEAGRRGGR